MIKAEKVSKGYDKIPVDRDVCMQVKRGEIHGLIGANGSGKTTLLKCLAGIYRPDAGRITYDGADIYDAPDVKQRARMIVCGRVGRITEFYTVGDRKQNLERLQKSEVKDLEGKQTTLEEDCLSGFRFCCMRCLCLQGRLPTICRMHWLRCF